MARKITAGTTALGGANEDSLGSGGPFLQTRPENNSVQVNWGFDRVGGTPISVDIPTEHNQCLLRGYVRPSTGTGPFIPNVQNIDYGDEVRQEPEIDFSNVRLIAYGGEEAGTDYAEAVLLNKDLVNFNESHTGDVTRLIGEVQSSAYGGKEAGIDYVEAVQLIGEDLYELVNFNEIHTEEVIRLIGEDLYELITFN